VTTDGINYCSADFGCFPAPEVVVSQFDPSLGTLLAITWSVTDEQTITYGYDDSTTLPPQPIGEEFNIVILLNLNSPGRSGAGMLRD
jgi:hypothetical protein